MGAPHVQWRAMHCTKRPLHCRAPAALAGTSECAMRLHVWFCVGFSLCVATLPAAAQWKWKDARGQVVISDTPPPREIPDRDVLQKPTSVLQRSSAAPVAAASAAAGETVAKAKVDPELEARRKKVE